MTINRALLPKQLQAGAPDITLTGDQSHRGTYTQRRRNQMAGGGITNARQGYGLGSLVQGLKDKFVEDIIPNELKTAYDKLIPNELKNPAVAATLANYAPVMLGGDDTLIQKGRFNQHVSNDSLYSSDCDNRCD